VAKNVVGLDHDEGELVAPERRLDLLVILAGRILFEHESLVRGVDLEARDLRGEEDRHDGEQRRGGGGLFDTPKQKSSDEALHRVTIALAGLRAQGSGLRSAQDSGLIPEPA